MKHIAVRYRRHRTAQQQREFCEAQSRRVSIRWQRYHAAHGDDPIRRSRIIEIRIFDSHFPRRLIRLECDSSACGWGRWRVTENGAPIFSGHKFGPRQIARMIAESLSP